MSVKAAKDRVERFLTAAASKKKAKSNKPKGKPKQPATVKAKNPAAFHDKMDAKLEKLAKKHGVSIVLRRNKSKLPTIVIGRLKNKKYGDVVKLFSEISNTAPTPQKMKENGASFRVFGPRKISANEDPQFIVKAVKNGKTVYMTASGGWGEKSKAEVFDEESADKVVRRINAKGDSNSFGKVQTERFESNDNKLTADESDENENTEDSNNEDDYEDDDGGDYEDGSNDDEGDTEEDEQNIAAMLKYITDNNIPRSEVNKVFDRAMEIYANDLKNSGPIDDSVGFIYDTLGPDDAKNAIKALANKVSLNNGGGV